MPEINYEIIQFNPENSSESMLGLYFNLLDDLTIEIDNDAILPTRDARMKIIKTSNPNIEKYSWLVLSLEGSRQAIGFAYFLKSKPDATNFSEYKHISEINIRILKDYRRKGIGSKLLHIIVDKLDSFKEITKLQTVAYLESGKKFFEKYSGKVTHLSVANKLLLSEVDWNLMKSWLLEGEQIANETGVILEMYDKIPDELLEEFCSLVTHITEDAPQGDREELYRTTPESYRQQEKLLNKQGKKLFTMITREPDGVISGMTDIYLDTSNPIEISQRTTGVKKEYRNRGLGKWLKASMLYFIVEKFPDAKYISTGNANNNTAMLTINERMGFKQSLQLWWFDIDLNTLHSTLNFEK